MTCYNMIYLLTTICLTSVRSSAVHIYKQKSKYRTTKIHRTTQINLEQCVPYAVFANCTQSFALQLREKLRKPSVRPVEELQLVQGKWNIRNGSNNKNTLT